MAKRTAIIDIGSNSISLVIYEKTSRFAFHLIEKSRARVRIGEGAYEHDGVLRDIQMDRAYGVLEDFLYISNNLKCRKILCVATSALRDAPNRGVFLTRVSKNLKLNIKIIDGKKEAYFGAVATSNLLPSFDEATTIDIGGGSTELSKIENGKIIDTLSLNVGTVRLKELFSEKEDRLDVMSSYIDKILSCVPAHFKSKQVIGIGGTIRSLSMVIMKKEEYPLDLLHAFSYRLKPTKKFINKIPSYSKKKLEKIGFSSNRLDTTIEGVLIFSRFLKKLEASSVITSKAGVREGVYLHDILRNSNYKFPSNFNVSIKSLIDRFALNEKNCSFVQRLSFNLFDTLEPIHQIGSRYRELLGFAAKLSPISKRLNIYSNSDNRFFFLLENLNFSLSHEEKICIAMLLKLLNRGEVYKQDIIEYDSLLPSFEVFEWLHFMISMSSCINANRNIQKIEFELVDKKKLLIKGEGSMYLARECIEKRYITSLKVKVV